MEMHFAPQLLVGLDNVAGSQLWASCDQKMLLTKPGFS